MQDRNRINRFLGTHGLAQLGNPGLAVQLAFLVRDHDHFRQLLVACEPEQRKAMYDAMSPNLRFQAKPLEDYIVEAKQEAEQKRLPTLNMATGELRAYARPEIRTAQAAIEDATAKVTLTLVCRKCTRQEVFFGTDRSDAIRKAREAGWTYNELKGDGREICPKCPA